MRNGFIGATLGLMTLAAAPAAAMEIRGLAEIRYTRAFSSRAGADQNGAFALGQFDLFVFQPLTDRIDVLSEIVFETDRNHDGSAEIERLEVGYRFSDLLTLHAGRYHNRIGYWNTAFHHGVIYQTTIDRPRFLRFEDSGGIFPIHVIGLEATGRFALGQNVLRYGLMGGNGARIDTTDHTLVPNVTADDNKNKLVTAELAFEPALPKGLRVGGFSSSSQVQGLPNGDPGLAPLFQVDQNIRGSYAVYQLALNDNDRIELLAEGFFIGDRSRFANRFFSGARVLRSRRVRSGRPRRAVPAVRGVQPRRRRPVLQRPARRGL